jgi:hypothetical protein
LNKAAPAVLAPGGRGREGGVRAAARELGISRTDARRAVHRVHINAREVREALRDMPEIADNGVELDALAALPAEQQAAAVAAVRNGTAPNVRAAIATIAEPTSCAAAKADQALDAILEQIRRLGKDDRERLWDALAEEWHQEISRALIPDRRIAPMGDAQRASHLEHPEVGRPGRMDQRPALRAGLRDR